jgi:hypothetical protein
MFCKVIKMSKFEETKRKVDKTLESSGLILKGIEFVDEHGYIDRARAILEVVGNLRLVGEV